MLVVSIGCGLGNQMFQYAYYKKLCSIYGQEEVKAEIFNIFPMAHNGYELKRVFGIDVQVADSKMIRRLTGHCLQNRWYSRILNKIDYHLRKKGFRTDPETYVKQRDFTVYYPELVYGHETEKLLYGVWANEEYFRDIKEEILEDFSFAAELDGSNKELAQKMQTCNSVSIHLRRGDYVDYKVEMLTETYYKNAINEICSRVKEPVFFVFSDEADYAKEFFDEYPHVYIISGNNGINAYKDMQLMSLCKHNIIANSSFSFWGAYLNRNEDKIIIAPNLPYTGCRNAFTCDDWVTISHK